MAFFGSSPGAGKTPIWAGDECISAGGYPDDGGPDGTRVERVQRIVQLPPFANILWAQLVRTNISRSAVAAAHNMLKSDGFHPDTVSITMAKE